MRPYSLNYCRSLHSVTSKTKSLLRTTRLLFSTEPSKAGQRAFDEAKAKTSSEAPTKLSINTLLAHTGLVPGENVPMSPPLHLSSTYTRPPDGIYLESQHIYSRNDNPTRTQLEETMIQLETHGDARPNDSAVSCAFASGMAGVTMILLAQEAPLTVLLPKALYHGVPTLLANVFCRFNVIMTQVDMTDAFAVKKAVLEVSTPQAILWMESPTNPMCQILDIVKLCEIVKKSTASSPTKFTTIVDSTLCPPCLTQPLRVSETKCCPLL